MCVCPAGRGPADSPGSLFQPLLGGKSHVNGLGQRGEECVSHPWLPNLQAAKKICKQLQLTSMKELHGFKWIFNPHFAGHLQLSAINKSFNQPGISRSVPFISAMAAACASSGAFTGGPFKLFTAPQSVVTWASSEMKHSKTRPLCKDV